MSEILAKTTRGMLVETMVRGSVVVIDQDAKIIASCGDPYLVTYLRSAAKPLQATALIEFGAAERFNLSPAEIAVMCGSPIGEDEQVKAVQSILDKIGLQESALSLKPSFSSDSILRARRIYEHLEPSRLYHDCAGKHAGMLAICQRMGWNINGYRLREHPVQQAIFDQVALFSELSREEILIGVDGCGVSVFGMPLFHMALAYLNLVQPERLGGFHVDAANQVIDALTAHPQMVSGKGRFDTELLRVTKGRVFGKTGSGGIYCCAVRDKGYGIAVKTEDGDTSMMPAILIRTFRQLDILSEEEHQTLRPFAVRDNLNDQGEKVGEIRAAFHLELF